MRPSYVKKVNVDLVYRIYYDPDTYICTQKTVEEIKDNLNFIYLDRGTYNSVEFCSLYRVKDGKLEKIPRSINLIGLELTQDGQFITTKNNMLFVSIESADSIDRWDFR